ncbi:MAG: DEAD/DEAH box helicase [Vulcanimicrobiaceae bacterium]
MLFNLADIHRSRDATTLAPPHSVFAAHTRLGLERKRDAADGAVDSWLETLASWHAQTPSRPARDHLRYAIDVQEQYYVPRFRLAAYIVPVLRSGGIGTPRSYDLHMLATGNAKHIMPVDRTIGRLINASGLLGGLGNVSPAILGTLLDVMIHTGRLHWRSIEEPALRLEPIDRARIAWRLDDDGRQRPHVEGRPSTVLLGSSPLWYVDTERLSAGPADLGIAEIGTLLASAPSLTDEQARRTQVSLRHVFASTGIEGPRVAVDLNVIDRDPTPLLFLSASDSFATIELQFAYGDHVVLPSDGAREFRAVDGDKVSSWPRRHIFERNALARLQDLGFSPLDFSHGQFSDRNRTLLRLASTDEARWIRFLGNVVPQLRNEGWHVEIDDRFPYAIVEADEEWHADLTESEQHWFELDLGIDVNGERVPLLPIIVQALADSGIGAGGDLTALAARSESIFGKLPSGAYVALPPARVARVLATLVDLFDGADALREDGRLHIAPLQAAAVADLDDTVRLHWKNARSLRGLVEALRGVDQRPVKLPRTFKAKLRPYQQDGVAWLQMLREHGFGGVLADDMGLGKTVQLLAHVAIEKAAGRLRAPVLIVAPTSVVPNWRSEIARFAPDLRVVSLTGADRAARFSQVGDADIALTTYALLPRDAEYLLEREWSIAVLDEAQAIKNPRAKAAVIATQVRAEQRFALTGTPVENHLEELWSIFAFAVPGLLGERSRFARFFRTPIEKRSDSLRQSALAARLRPFLLRRTKERVADDLPEKTEIVQRVELAGTQRDLYETIRLAMHKRVRDEVQRRGLARSRIVVLDALLKLRQVCCDPRLLKLPAASGVKESQKLEALIEMLESLTDEGRRVLLFSQFTSMLDLIKPELTKRHLPFVELRGDTRDRETPVQRFQNGEVPLFLISLKAGGTGLNLTAADTVIHYDPWWNPAVERQATDRAHRIGQEQHVFVYKLIAEGTVEERILELQERKGALAASLFDEASRAPLPLELEDIERLFT